MGISSIIILPIIVIYIIIYGFLKKVNIYDEFLIGAKEGLITTFKIIPNIVAMIFAINILIKSNMCNCPHLDCYFAETENFWNQFHSKIANVILLLQLKSI